MLVGQSTDDLGYAACGRLVHDRTDDGSSHRYRGCDSNSRGDRIRVIAAAAAVVTAATMVTTLGVYVDVAIDVDVGVVIDVGVAIDVLVVVDVGVAIGGLIGVGGAIGTLVGVGGAISTLVGGLAGAPVGALVGAASRG